MKLILKSTIRNIFIKPIRTMIMILCIAAVSLAFSLCLLIQLDSKGLVEDEIRTATGKADLVVSTRSQFNMEEITLPKDTEALFLRLASVNLQLHSMDNYKYVQKKEISVLGLDVATACRFEMLPKGKEIAEDEIIISFMVADLFGYKEGDSICLPCVDGSQLTFTVKEILPCEKLFSLMPQSVIVTPEKANALIGKEENTRNVIYIDVMDDSKISQANKEISETEEDLEIQQIIGSKELDEMVLGLTSAFFIVFAVVFLMVIFIVSGFTKNIVVERLPVIGTLRSIGADKKAASFVLILESVVYGFIGGSIGAMLVYLVKDTVMNSVVATSMTQQMTYHMPVYIPFISVIVSILITCGCSLFSVIGIVKTPLRDIIFGNKDTCYKLSYIKVGFGVILLGVFGGLYMIKGNFLIELLAFVCFEVGICFLIPLLLNLISGLLAKFTTGSHFPVLRLSLIQLGTKKTSVSGTVLCTAVISLTMSVFVLSSSIDKLYSAKNYHSDIVISGLSEKAKNYENVRNADGVLDSEMIYCTEENIKINNNDSFSNVFGYAGFKMFDGIKDLPETIEKNQVVLDKAMLKRLNISVGDTIEVTLKANSIRPVTLQLTVVGTCDSVYYNMRCNAIFLNMEDYKQVYHDYPSVLLLKTNTQDISQKLKNQFVDKGADIKTAIEYYEQKQLESSSITNVLKALIFLGIALAVISVIGNQSIGFEQRKREYAVLYSAGMSKKQLIQMIITELSALAVVSTMISVISGTVIVKILSRLLLVLELSIPVFYQTGEILSFISVLFAVIMFTGVMPVRALLKMNTSNQLKYE